MVSSQYGYYYASQAALDAVAGLIIICTHKTGSDGSDKPDISQGSLLYLFSPSVAGSPKSETKFKNTSGDQSFSSMDGKFSRSITLENLYVVKWTNGVSVSTNTDAFNEILGFLEGRNMIAQTPVYLYVKNAVDNTYLKLSRNSSSVRTRFFKGYPISFPWKMTKGNVYYFTSLTFVEAKQGG